MWDGVRVPEISEPSASDGNTGDGGGDGGDGEGMRFLREVRTDCSPGFWQELLPGREISVEVAEADHFGMMVRLFYFAFPLSFPLSFFAFFWWLCGSL